MALALQLFQHLSGVAAVAQGGIQAHLARLDGQKVQDLPDHDGPVHPGGGLAAADDLGHVLLVFLRIQLFVFFLKVPGMGPFVADPALVLLFHGDQLLYFKSYLFMLQDRAAPVNSQREKVDKPPEGCYSDGTQHTRKKGARTMRTVWPDYYPAFSCIASQCRHSCCIGWEIDIDPETLARYDTMEGAMGDRLRGAIHREETPHFRLIGDEERCPFLNGEGLCDLILHGGEGMLCQICTDHPRFRTFLPERTEVGVGLCCEAAGRLILSQREPVQLVGSGEEDGEPEEVRSLLALRQQALDLAQDRSLSVRQREDALLEAFRGWVPDLSPAQWAAFYLSLERMDETWTAHLEALRAAGDALDLAGFAAYMASRQTEYEQLLVYFLYRHFLTAREDGDPAGKVAFAVCSVRFLELLGSLHWTQHGSFTLDDQVEYARLYSAEVEYSQENLDLLFDSLCCVETDDFTP